ncbi:hypothetical protein AMELA_G00175170, partial [Ameiurus melas]
RTGSLHIKTHSVSSSYSVQWGFNWAAGSYELSVLNFFSFFHQRKVRNLERKVVPSITYITYQHLNAVESLKREYTFLYKYGK